MVVDFLSVLLFGLSYLFLILNVPSPPLQQDMESFAVDAISYDKLPAGYLIPSAKIADGTITAAKIVDGEIKTFHIVDGAVTAGKIAVGGVSAENIAAGAITPDKIADNGVYAYKALKAKMLGTDHLEDASVTGTAFLSFLA